MKSKTKILLASGFGAAAVVGGVTPAIVSATSQSSVVNIDTNVPTNPNNPTNPTNPVDPNNPTNPTNPVGPSSPDLLFATAPTADVFKQEIKLASLNDENLNAYLSEALENSNFYKETFENASQYENVTISFVKNSASVSNSNFKIDVTPISGANWKDNNSNNAKKVITVRIDSLFEDSNDSNLKANATVPLFQDNSIYNNLINGSNFSGNEDLEKYFVDLFKGGIKITDSSQTSFAPINKDNIFNNVVLTYVKGSASLSSKTFKVEATPINGSTWSTSMGNVGESVQLTVRMVVSNSDWYKENVQKENIFGENKPVNGNDVSEVVKNARVPMVYGNSSYNVLINQPTMETNVELDNYFINLFKNGIEITNPQTAFTPIVEDNIFENVVLTYVKGSADLSSKTFKVIATPRNNGQWWEKMGNVAKSLELLVHIGKINYDVEGFNAWYKENNPNEVIKNARVPVVYGNSSYNVLIDQPSMKTNVELDNYFINLFKDGIKITNPQTAFTPIVADNTFEDVVLTYVKGSADLSSKTFKVIATPRNNGQWWEKMGNVAKSLELLVHIGKINYDVEGFNAWYKENNPNEVIKNARVPVLYGNSSYNVLIDQPSMKTNVELDNYFINLFKDGIKITGSQTAFTPIVADNTFEDVVLTYVKGSADLSSKTFKVIATPRNNGQWWEKMGNVAKSLELLVHIGKINYDVEGFNAWYKENNPNEVIKNARVPVLYGNSSYNVLIDQPSMKTNVELDNYFINLFKDGIKITGSQTAFTPIVADNTFEDVVLTYVKGSADLFSKTFKVIATPRNNGQWWEKMGNVAKSLELLVHINYALNK